MNKLFDIKPRGVVINVHAGCYFFDNEAAIGKTYLGSLLKRLNEAGRLSACTITYIRDRTSEDIISYLIKNQYEIVFFDRLDLYITKELCNFLAANCYNSIYLLDIKNLNKVNGIGLKYVELILTKDKIEVISV